MLPSEFSLQVFYSLIDILIDQTQLNESHELFKDIQRKLLLLQKRAEKMKLFEFVCGAYLLTARLYFYRYMLDEGTDYIDKVSELATTYHLYYFIQKASIEVDSFNKIKDTIKNRLLLTEENTLTLERNFEQYQKQILDYATKAKEIIEREDN